MRQRRLVADKLKTKRPADDSLIRALWAVLVTLIFATGSPVVATCGFGDASYVRPEEYDGRTLGVRPAISSRYGAGATSA